MKNKWKLVITVFIIRQMRDVVMDNHKLNISKDELSHVEYEKVQEFLYSNMDYFGMIWSWVVQILCSMRLLQVTILL